MMWLYVYVVFYILSRASFTYILAKDYDPGDDVSGLWLWSMTPLAGELLALLFFVIWTMEEGVDMLLLKLHKMIDSIENVEDKE